MALNERSMVRAVGTAILLILGFFGWVEGTSGKAPAIRWREDLGRGVVGSPVVEGEVCVIPLVDGNLVCLGLADGKILWRRKPCRSIVSPVVIREERIYGSGADERDAVFCMDLRSGRLRWQKQRGGILSGLCVVEDAVIGVGRDGHVVCLDAGTGQVRWRVPVRRLALFPPAASGTGVLVPTLGDSLYFLSVGSGERVWAVEVPGGVAGTPAVRGDTLFVASQRGRVAALAARDGSPVWQVETGAAFHRGPLPWQDSLFLASTAGRVWRLDGRDGRTRWSVDLETILRAPPALRFGQVILGTLTGRLVGLDPETGSRAWTLEVNGGMEARVVGSNGTAVAATDRGDVYILEGAGER